MLLAVASQQLRVHVFGVVIYSLLSGGSAI